jgi:preprotein translocase subunit SecE
MPRKRLRGQKRPIKRDNGPGRTRTLAGDRVKEEGMKKLVQFIKESYAELRKVIWPGRDDVISSVKVVIVSTILIAAVLGLVDVLLLFGIRAIF